MKPKLKPCPFCGSEAELSDDYWFYSVNCTNTNCEAETKRLGTEHEAIEVWNKRHNEVAPVDEVPNLDSQKREVLS